MAERFGTGIYIELNITLYTERRGFTKQALIHDVAARKGN